MADEILDPAKHYVTFSNLPDDVQTAMAAQAASAVAAALARFGEDHAQEVVEGITGDGNDYYDLSDGLTAWDEDSSSVLAVEYPYTIGEDNELDLSEWSIEIAPSTGKTLYLNESSPAATETIKVTFTAPWAESSVPSRYVHPVAMLAGSYLARMIAARMAQSNESTVNADTFQRNVAARDWQDIADKLLVGYETALGVGGGSGADGGAAGPPAASVDLQIQEGSGHGRGKIHDYADD